MRIYQKIGKQRVRLKLLANRESPLIIGGCGGVSIRECQLTVSVKDAVCVSVPLVVDAVPVTVTV